MPNSESISNNKKKRGFSLIRRKNTKEAAEADAKLRVIPLGGLNEIGKNITLLEYEDDILIIDCGMSFPEAELFGIDLVLPDFSYLIQNAGKIRGMILTHAHEDHIGAIPYLLQQLSVPIYGTKLAIGLVNNKLKEHSLTADFHEIKAGQSFRIGCFRIEAIRTTHSIADALAFAIQTPVGTVFHSGDFKFDQTPLDGHPADLQRIAEVGREGVLLMLSDSTNAEHGGYTPSEQIVRKTFEDIFRSRDGRILIASFSTNIHRIQIIIDTAVKFKRKVALSGRSMVNVVSLAIELGYLTVPPDTLVDIAKIKNIKSNELVIITTGSQGEPMSALARMASNDHKSVQIRKGDVVILSSNPIPGNERTVSNVINQLFEKGAEVIYSSIAQVHVSGHAREEELKLLFSLVKPRFFVPVHGEYRHLCSHAAIAEEMGLKHSHVHIMENGQVLELNRSKAVVLPETVPCQPVFVDGLGVGDVGNVVLKDRRVLSTSGLIVVTVAWDPVSQCIISGPEIVTRGFVYVKENENLIEEAKTVVTDAIEGCSRRDFTSMKTATRDALRSFIYEKNGRSPMILPIFLQV